MLLGTQTTFSLRVSLLRGKKKNGFQVNVLQWLKDQTISGQKGNFKTSLRINGNQVNG